MPGCILNPAKAVQETDGLGIPTIRGREIMDRLPIKGKDVKQILKNRMQMLASIHTRLDYLHDDTVQTADIIETVSLRSKTLSDMPKGGGGHKDLFAEYEKYHALLEKRYRECAEGIHELVLYEECIERTWLCFQALESEAYTLLHRLYVQNELYSTVEADSRLAHAAFEKRRKRAIADIIRLYESEVENDSIFRIAERIRSESSVQDKTKEENSQQISFMDMLENTGKPKANG